jgi:hypothetical protein
MAGLVKLNTIVNVSQINRYPIGHSKWEVKRTKTKIKYSLVVLTQGQFFGHEEVNLNPLEKTKIWWDTQTPDRRYEAIALGKCEVFKISKKVFRDFFNQIDQNMLVAKHPFLDLDKVREAILCSEILKKKNSNAIFDAT